MSLHMYKDYFKCVCLKNSKIISKFSLFYRKVSKVTYIIAPSFGGVFIPDEELESATETILLQTFAKYLPTIKILTNKVNKRKYFVVSFLSIF